MAWYLDWFGKEYLELYSHRSDEEAQRQVGFIVQTLQLSPQSRILDIACGRGRHLAKLAELGFSAVGLDRSLVSLQAASERLNKEASLFEADMRALPFSSGSYDALLSLFTSFGYFDSDKEHAELLAEWRRVLKPGGALFIDYLNKDFVVANLEEKTESCKNGKYIEQRRYLSDNNSRINKDIFIYSSKDAASDKAEAEFKESVRMYSLDELTTLIEGAGFQLEAAYGDFTGEPFEAESPRLLVAAVGK